MGESSHGSKVHEGADVTADVDARDSDRSAS
jgi:hypothetical protein